MDKSIFNRTVKTNIVLYPTDGMGRDGYITYNDAGFWKENIKQIYPKVTYGRKPFAVYKSIRRIPPSWKYHSDGTGRDTYVLYNYGGLIKKYSPLGDPNNNLRSGDEEKVAPPPKFALSKAERLYLKQLNNVQKGLVDRLYNKCIDKFRSKNLCKSNSCASLEDNLRQSDFPMNPPSPSRNNFNSFSKSKMMINSNSSNDLNNSGNLKGDDDLQNKIFGNRLNYRGSYDNNDFYNNYKGGSSGSLPKKNINNLNDFKKYRVKVLSNNLNKNLRYPLIATPRNHENEEENYY